MLLCDCLMLGYAFSVWEMSDYFEITWTIFALGSASVPHASMRAWRFEPLPEIRTVMFFSAMFLFMSPVARDSGANVSARVSNDVKIEALCPKFRKRGGGVNFGPARDLGGPQFEGK